jgi:crotonobetainyl-CoA:carnitine CoA-transferase CaiB-like acyl-CoA transferase
VQLSRTPAVTQTRVRPGPQVGEHTGAVLAEYGFAPTEIQALAAAPRRPGKL